MRHTILILLVAGWLSDAAPAGGNVITVRLEAQNNSGQTGTAILQSEGDRTKVVIELSNVPAGGAQPAHIHRGSCDKLDKAPKWTLKAVSNGKSVTVLPVALDIILEERAAINIHKSAIETQVYVSCGDIAGAMY